jgi:FixJ family two-component response regulator
MIDQAAINPKAEAVSAGCVFVVDDDMSVREALEMLIHVSDLRVETFEHAQAFLDRPPFAGPACLVLDVNLPAISGFDVQMQLTERRKDMPIIFITGHGDIPMTVRAMRAGAFEFLTKPFVDRTLLDAIERALEHSARHREQAAELAALRERHASLTAREREVMTLVVAGLLNKQIGAKLGAAEPTVKVHRGRVMRKMGASSLADLVRLAAKLGE